MATQEERLSTLEQVVASLRQDFLQAIVENTRSMSTLNKVIAQQEQNVRDGNHEITILLGVASSQGKDIREVKERLNGFDQRLDIMSQQLDATSQRMEGGFEEQGKKLDQIMLLLNTLTSKPE